MGALRPGRFIFERVEREIQLPGRGASKLAFPRGAWEREETANVETIPYKLALYYVRNVVRRVRWLLYLPGEFVGGDAFIDSGIRPQGDRRA